jgi:hypothetical protein
MTADLMFLVTLSILVGIYAILWGETRAEKAEVREVRK